MTLAPDDQRHGTRNGYNNLGCRCDRCRAAWTEYYVEWTHRTSRHLSRENYLALLASQPPPPHGTSHATAEDAAATSADAHRQTLATDAELPRA